MFPNPRDLAWIQLKNLSIKTEHYHTSFFPLQKIDGAVSGIVWADAIKVKMLREKLLACKLVFKVFVFPLRSWKQIHPTQRQRWPVCTPKQSQTSLSSTLIVPSLAKGSGVENFLAWSSDPFYARKKVWKINQGPGSEVCHVLGWESMSHVLSHFRRLISAEERATWPYVKGL